MNVNRQLTWKWSSGCPVDESGQITIGMRCPSQSVLCVLDSLRGWGNGRPAGCRKVILQSASACRKSTIYPFTTRIKVTEHVTEV
jgi:hypothetical protein